jgi:hypothetical protein
MSQIPGDPSRVSLVDADVFRQGLCCTVYVVLLHRRAGSLNVGHWPFKQWGINFLFFSK